MGQLKRADYRYIYCFVTGIVTGILIGAVALSIAVSYKMDSYHKKIAQLETDIEDREIRLNKLEESINTKRYILKDLEIIIINADGQENEVEKTADIDDLDKLEIEKNIKEKYTSLLGKEVENIDADMVAEIIDKRIFKIEDREYKLYVSKLIMTDILKVWVNVEVIS